MTPRAKTRLKIWLAVLGIFVLGGLTGAALDSALRLKGSMNERPGARGLRGRGDVFERMKRDLNLTEQQATEIRAILDQARDEYRQLRQEVRPRYDAVRQQARARIRERLTPEQQKVFDAKVAEHDSRHNGEGRDER